MLIAAQDRFFDSSAGTTLSQKLKDNFTIE